MPYHQLPPSSFLKPLFLQARVKHSG
ncbi:rCG22452 [Rattus norvegicus]|uniref:RCG22452 n=1 Tax=Rattus norvegicus TaxID=10116 RepID=A6IN85_RAT|nr:rCG22452 [Rattus norvegicus]